MDVKTGQPPQPPRVKLMMDAINAVNRETTVMVQIVEAKIKALVDLIKETYDVYDFNDIFAHPKIDDLLKVTLQSYISELAEWKRARYDVTLDLNNRIADMLREEREG